MTAAWLVLSVPDGERSHGGNDGYDDAPSRYYSWDSTVPHSDDIYEDDFIALWNKKTLLGVSRIARIVRGSAVKKIYTCPGCRKGSFKPRITRIPRYRCGAKECLAEFDVPVGVEKEVVTYRSEHAADWVDLPGVLSGGELRQMCDKPTAQHSLRRLEWDRLRQAVEGARSGSPLTVVEAAAAQLVVGGHKRASVRVRVGQGAFRGSLLDRYGAMCAFSGPAPEPALEAAHLYSYADAGEHFEDGGLLLRRDLHSLFDRGLIAVRPEELTLDIAPSLGAYSEYRRLDGAPLQIPLRPGHLAWLRAHWTLHRGHRQQP